MPFDAQEYARALKQLPRERQRERLIQLRDKNPQAFTAVMSSFRNSSSNPNSGAASTTPLNYLAVSKRS